MVGSVGTIAVVVVVCFAFCGGGVRGNAWVTRGGGGYVILFLLLCVVVIAWLCFLVVVVVL